MPRTWGWEPTPREEADARVDRLVDKKMFLNDPVYHANVEMTRQFLVAVEMAMHDEGVDDDVIRKVLNRMTYGTPSGFVSRMNEAEIAELRKTADLPHFYPGGAA